jgi:hypothetical protein
MDMAVSALLTTTVWKQVGLGFVPAAATTAPSMNAVEKVTSKTGKKLDTTNEHTAQSN